MNLKNFSLVAFMLSIYTLGFSQTLKTFNGKYDDGTINKGNANYTYYIDKNTQEYIKHGLFRFTYSDKDEISSQKVYISGNYKNNKRDGVWSFSISLIDWPSAGGDFLTGTKTLTANYSNGKPNGAWIYKYNVKKREKRFSTLGFTWSSYSSVPSELVTANFRDGIIMGSVKFINVLPYGDYSSISGQFDNNGNLVGTWTFNSSEKEKVVVFKNGILTSFIVREIGSGRITSKEIDNTEMIQIKDDYIAGKTTLADLLKLKIKIDTIDAVKNQDYDFILSFKSPDFRFQYIPGDESYYYRPSIYNETTHEYTQESGWVDTRNEGIFYIFTQTPSYKLSDLKEYNTANEYYDSSDFQKAQEIFSNIKYQYINNLNEKDISIIQTKLVQCKKEIEKRDRDSQALSLYHSVDLSLNLNLEKEALENLDTLLSKYPDVFSPSELSNIQKKHDELFQKLREKDIDKKEWAQINENQDSITILHSKISALYKPSDENFFGLSTTKKPHLINAYTEIYSYIKTQISNDNRKAKLENSNLLVSIQHKVINLFSQESKDIEKKLKKANTITDKINILK